MKRTMFANQTAATLLLLVALIGVGCKRNPQGTTPLPGYGKGSPTDVDRSKMIPPGDDSTAGVIPVGDRLRDWTPAANQPAALRDNTVYFDYDSASVKAGEQSKLDAVAGYVKSGNHAIRVEGHCDERGTEEYNRSLGERRALAVREYLVRAGVGADRIDTISHGEDKPAVTGRGDAVWAKNRRAEFLLLQPPSGVGATAPQ